MARIAFTTVRHPYEGKYNEGRDTIVYQGSERVTGFCTPSFARIRREQLAKQLAEKTGGDAWYTTPQFGDEIPEGDKDYKVVSNDCWVVETPEQVVAEVVEA